MGSVGTNLRLLGEMDVHTGYGQNRNYLCMGEYDIVCSSILHVSLVSFPLSFLMYGTVTLTLDCT